MSSQQTLVTPATYAASDAGASSFGKPRRKWKLSGKKPSSSLPESSLMPDTATKVKRSNNPVKRAFRKIGKIRKRAPPPSTDTTASASDPPKIEDLGIDPRLLEKWKARKELKKQVAVGGSKELSSRGTATLVAVGLYSGSVDWLRDRVRRWRHANGILFSACIVALAVGVACTLILRRCA